MSNAVNEVVKKARSIVFKLTICHLATVDGSQPAVRPMGFVLTEEGELWFSTSAKSRKVSQLRKNPNAEAYFTDDKGFHCKIDGVCIVSSDSKDRKRQWKAQPGIKNYFKSVDDPNFIIIRLKPKRYEILWEGDSGYQVSEA